MTETFSHPELLLAQSDWLRRLARQLAGDPDGAEELAQATVVAALARPAPERAGLRTWLEAIARRLAAGSVRTDHRRRRREQVAARSEREPSAADSFERFVRHRSVVDAVMALDEIHRTAVLLRYWDDLPPRTIAKRLAVPVETVRSRLKRGLALLRASLDAEHGDTRGWLLPLLTLPAAPLPAVDPATASAAGAATAGSKALLVGAGAILVGGALAVGVWPTPDAAPRGLAAPAAAAVLDAAPNTTPAPNRHQVAIAVAQHPPGLAGHVFNGAGRGLAGVEVCVLDAKTCRRFGLDAFPAGAADTVRFNRIADFLLHLSANNKLASHTVLRTGVIAADVTATDADGRFELPNSKPRGGAFLIAWSPDHGVQFAALPTDRTTPADIRFAAWPRIGGRVTHAGRPVEGATVRISHRGRAMPIATFETGTDGRFQTPPVPAGEYTVAAEAADLDYYRVPWQQVNADVDLGLELRTKHELRLRLVDADGAAWTGTRLAALGWNPQLLKCDLTAGHYAQRLLLEVDVAHTELDYDAATGELSAALDSGRRKVLSLWCGLQQLASVELRDLGQRGVIVQLAPPAASLELRVGVGFAAGAKPADAVEAAFVAVGPGSSYARTLASTQGGPGPLLLSIPAGTQLSHGHLVVTAPEFAPRWVRLAIPQQGAFESQQVELQPGDQTLAGRVVDEAGEPVGGAMVVITDPAGGPLRAPVAARKWTEADGQFRFEALAAGAVRVLVSRSGKAATAVAAAAGGGAPLVVELRQGRRVTVRHDTPGAWSLRVLDAAGLPLTDGWVMGSQCYGPHTKILLDARAHTIEGYRAGAAEPWARALVPAGDTLELPWR